MPPTWPGSMRPSLPAKIPKKGAVFEDPLGPKGDCGEVRLRSFGRYIPGVYIYIVPVVPHKAVAEVSKIGNL